MRPFSSAAARIERQKRLIVNALWTAGAGRVLLRPATPEPLPSIHDV
jgi:hypothetical protein